LSAAARRGGAGSAVPEGVVELRDEVRPPWPFRLRRGGSPDGLTRRRGSALQRWLHPGGRPAFVGVVQPAADRVLFAARAGSPEAARAAIARMRFATGVDDDLRPFYERFRDDRVLGRAVRAHPRLRVARHPEPWVALAWAVTEQLIEFERAIAIQRRLIALLGPRCADTGMRDAPAPPAVAAVAPARLEACDLAARRALALRAAAREVASGRVDLDAPDHEAGWRRLRAIPNVGPWTLEVLALFGQGRYDKVPAGDLGFLKLVGRLSTGNPRARADEAEVRGFFDAYGEWRGLAGIHLRGAAARGLLPAAPVSIRIPAPRTPPGPVPRPAGTRWSAPAPRSAAA
jgi:3-methyladenine DNA glycosylase/8-oxoguanine DNA glycosylase